MNENMENIIGKVIHFYDKWKAVLRAGYVLKVWFK